MSVLNFLINLIEYFFLSSLALPLICFGFLILACFLGVRLLCVKF